MDAQVLDESKLIVRPLDHAAFGWNHQNADNVIDSDKLEHAFREKPVATFSQHALVEGPVRASREAYAAVAGRLSAREMAAPDPGSAGEASVDAY